MKFVESLSNISYSALLGDKSDNMYSDMMEFVTGSSSGYPFPGTESTPVYYTTMLYQNSITLEDGDEYLIGDHASSSSTLKNDSSNDYNNIASTERNNGSYYSENRTFFSDLPPELSVVDETAWPRIYAYFIVFTVSAIANFCELVWVCRRLRTRASPVNRLFLHLCIADLIVVFMVAAVEVLWRISIGWYAGNLMCKGIMFCRAFGLYLSSLMIVCISLDRFYAVVYPLRVIDASRRVKIMLTSAWVTSAVCAIPQSIVFREETHPYYPNFHQCATIWWPGIERANTWLSMTMMYFFPLGIIIFAYGAIIIKIAGYLRENRGDGSTFLRRNGMPVFQRAKLRTLKLTAMIVFAFVFCWTPYILISTWYLIDEHSAGKIDGNIQDALFIMAVANSIANPLVYGFNESCKKRKETTHDACKEAEHQSDAGMLQNYSSRYTHKTRVRFSTQEQSAV